MLINIFIYVYKIKFVVQSGKKFYILMNLYFFSQS